MSTNQRGFLILAGIIVFGVIFCGIIPFVVMPGAGVAVSMPVITVPGEPYIEDWPSPDFVLVNTLAGMLLADVIVIVIALLVRARSRGWKNEVPGRFQGMVELIVGGWWSLTKQMAGQAPKVRNILFPVTATILVFLLAANWGKLLPTVESVGVIHCAHDGFNGLPRTEIGALGTKYYQLRNEGVFNVGTMVTEAAYKQCKSFKDDHYADYAVTALDPFEDARLSYTVQEGDTLESIAADFVAQANEIAAAGLPEGERYEHYTGYADVNISAESILVLNSDLRYVAAAEEHNEEAAEGEEAAAVALTAFNTPLEAGQVVTVRSELIGEQATTLDNQLFAVTPFIRGAATDLNLTIGLALLAFVLIQAFGVSELGLNYFQKFINIHALGNLGKRPLGAVDFIAGLFEIVSEFGKIISLSFRLFGAIFAGTVLYAVILFLAGVVTPVLILTLEVIVGMAQAGVFAVLTLIFCAQAMVSHHHDDDHAEAHH